MQLTDDASGEIFFDSFLRIGPECAWKTFVVRRFLRSFILLVLLNFVLPGMGLAASECQNVFQFSETASSPAPMASSTPTIVDPAKIPATKLRAIEIHFDESGMQDQIAQMRTFGKGIISAKEFLQKQTSFGEGYLLAVDQMALAARTFSDPLSLKHWPDGYREFRIFPRANGHTETYMSAITGTGKPIVFFVPPKMNENKGITYNEMQWLLERPESMKNVTFVFGMYEVIPPEIQQAFSRRQDWVMIREYLRRVSAENP